MNISVATWKAYREKRKLQQKMLDTRLDIEWNRLMEAELEAMKNLSWYRPSIIMPRTCTLPVTVEDCLDWMADGKPIHVRKLEIKEL